MPQAKRTAKTLKGLTEYPGGKPLKSLLGAQPLPAAFYSRDPRQVARELLGKLLVRQNGGQVLAGRVVEVEAYLGQDDPAAHAYSGPTRRNFVLFGPPGRAYVYFIYGNHYCLNVSCEPAGKAGCVLFRALEPVLGIEEMASTRHLQIESSRAAELRFLTSGPGRLTQAFGITRQRDNDKDLTSANSDLRIVDDGFQADDISATKRVGIVKATEEPLRFLIPGNPFVSRPRG